MKDRPITTDPEASALVAELVRAARAERPKPRSRQRAMIALGLGAGTAHWSLGSAGAAQAASSVAAGKTAGLGFSALAITKSLIVGAVAGGMALGTAAYTGVLAREPRSVPADHAVVAATAPGQRPAASERKRGSGEPGAGDRVAPDEQGDPTEQADENAAGGPPERPVMGEPYPGAAPTSAPSPALGDDRPARANGTMLGEELGLLEAARAELAAHRAGQALWALGRHAERFPSGRLGLEADVLRIEALLEIGRAGEAVDLARRFLAANRQSPLAGRVRIMMRDAESRR